MLLTRSISLFAALWMVLSLSAQGVLVRGSGGSYSYPAGLDRIYEFTEGSGQSLADVSGGANHAQLGNTAGADASDPAWATESGDDYLDFVLNTDWVEFPTETWTGEFTFTVLWHRDTTDDLMEILQTNAGTGSSKILSRSTYFVRAGTLSGSDVSQPIPAVDTWQIFTIRRNASNKIDMFIDNGTAQRLYGDAAQSDTTKYERIGGGGDNVDLDGGVAFYASGDLALTDSEIEALHCYVTGTLKAGLGVSGCP